MIRYLKPGLCGHFRFWMTSSIVIGTVGRARVSEQLSDEAISGIVPCYDPRATYDSVDRHEIDLAGSFKFETGEASRRNCVFYCPTISLTPLKLKKVLSLVMNQRDFLDPGPANGS